MRAFVGRDLWLAVPNNVPLGGSGPVDVPFERLLDSHIERPVFERFESIVERHPDRTAIDDGVVRVTYRELMRACRHLAARLDALVPPRAPVGVMVPNGALVPVAMLACLAVGRPFVPLDCNSPAVRNEQIMAEAGAKALLVDGGSKEATPVVASVAQIDIANALAADADDVQVPLAAATAPALILFTSGSMGRPKGICLDQRSISHNASHYTNSCHLNADDRIALLSTAATIVGATTILTALLNGATLVVADPRRAGITGVLRIFRDQRVTWCYTVPTLLRELMNTPDAEAAFASFRAVRIGGENVRAADVALCRKILPSSCHIQVTYGSTETGTIFEWFVPPDWTADGPRVPCGYTVRGQSVCLRYDESAPSRGELVVKSRYIALGVWQDGRLQPGPFEQDPHDPSLRILQTGDLAQLREDGLAEIIGRTDRQVKIRGLRVNPVEVEDALCRFNDVAEAVVIARQDGEDTATLVAFVVARHTSSASFLSDLQAAIASRLPGHLRPTHIRVVDKIPLLPNFKPDIAVLEDMAKSLTEIADGHAIGLAPDAANPIPEAVALAWTRVLGQPSFDPHKPWHETGGDSLKKLQLWLHIEKTLGVRLPFEPFDDRATPNEIAASVERTLAAPGQRAAASPVSTKASHVS